MGLIKTAIMTGGGIYAISKITKAAEKRHSSNSPGPNDRRQMDANPPQGYQGPAPYQQQSQSREARYMDNNGPQEQQYGYHDNRNANPQASGSRVDPTRNYDGSWPTQGDYRGVPDEKRLMDANPPSYSTRESGYVLPETRSHSPGQSWTSPSTKPDNERRTAADFVTRDV